MEAALLPQTQVHTFYSRGKNLRLIRKPAVVIETAIGTQMTVQEPVRYEFAPDGFLNVPEGKDVFEDGPPEPGSLAATPQDAVAWLRRHREFNVEFFEQGNERDRPLPTDQDFLAAVTAATAAVDTAALQALIEQEQSTHDRPMLVNAAQAALGQVERLRAEYEAQAAAEAKAAESE